jgi:hypothetical protein
MNISKGPSVGQQGAVDLDALIDHLVGQRQGQSVRENELFGLAGDQDPEFGLAGVRFLRRTADAFEGYQVERAREQGWSWERIGAALKVSAQAAHKSIPVDWPSRDRAPG